MPLTMSMSAAQLLKKRTFDAHTKAENNLNSKLNSITTYGDYGRMLTMFYGFFQPLEKVITQYIGKEILYDIDERRNSNSILIDLKAIGQSTKAPLICTDLPNINSTPEALGAMYVLEGSTLGGRMISRILMKNDFVKFDASNLHFFIGYGENTGSKWINFLSVLNQYENEANDMVRTANDTFNCLTKWMETVYERQG